MSEITLTDLMAAWDRLNIAAQGICIAQPSNMTARAEALEDARLAMANRMNQYARSLNYKNMQ